jgi:putative ABC transport system substrate-binding protein
MRRREFIVGLGSAAAWPVVARALPVVAFLSDAWAGATVLAALREGLREQGFLEGRNVAVEYRSAEGQHDKLPQMAADLVRRRISVIVASGLEAALAAKAATTTIPIIFRTGNDPVQSGLVTSFNRPTGNITGINDFNVDLGQKRLQFLHDLLPGASRFAALTDTNTALRAPRITDLRAAASTIGVSIEIVTANDNREIDAAFASLAQKRIDALWVDTAGWFSVRHLQLALLTTYYHLPAIFGGRQFTESGGLMSYGPDFSDQIRQAGIYTGRVLKGEKPSDLPVMRPTKFEFVVNLQTARIFGIEVPPNLLAKADEVIE